MGECRTFGNGHKRDRERQQKRDDIWAVRTSVVEEALAREGRSPDSEGKRRRVRLLLLLLISAAGLEGCAEYVHSPMAMSNWR